MATNRSRKLVRQSRALGIALTPKAERLMQRRPYRPGEHGRGRVKESDYSIRLKEKQRLRAQYGIREAQLRKIWTRPAGWKAWRVRTSSSCLRCVLTPSFFAPVLPARSPRLARLSFTVTSSSTASL